MLAGFLHGQTIERVSRPGRELRHLGHVVLPGVHPAVADAGVPGGHVRHAPVVPAAGRPAGRGLRGAGHHSHLPSRGHAVHGPAGPSGAITAAAGAVNTNCPGGRLVVSGGRLGGGGGGGGGGVGR